MVIRVRLRAAGPPATIWLLLPQANQYWMSPALAEWARWADHLGRKWLLVDGARWHTSGKLELPGQVELFPLPPSTPKLQPAEPAWPLLREVLANEAFDSLDPVLDKLSDRCCWFLDHPESIQGAVAFDWAAALNQ